MRKCLLNFIFLGSITVSLLNNCASPRFFRGENVDTSSLESLQKMSDYRSPADRKNEKQGKIREMALKEVALSIGAQAGLANKAKSIDERLITEARNLDTIFDFNGLIINQNIMPPVLQEGRNSLNLADEQTIRIVDHTYKILKQAKFVTTAPNWRQYLWMDYKKPELPETGLLPQDSEEQKLWADYIRKGWKNGEEQGNSILEDNLARIKQDFKGMVLYRKLLAMNMVSPPFVAETDLGITGDTNEINIDDRVLRITALPELNINSNDWLAAVSKDDNEVKKFEDMENNLGSSKIDIQFYMHKLVSEAEYMHEKASGLIKRFKK